MAGRSLPAGPAESCIAQPTLSQCTPHNFLRTRRRLRKDKTKAPASSLSRPTGTADPAAEPLVAFIAAGA